MSKSKPDAQPEPAKPTAPRCDSCPFWTPPKDDPGFMQVVGVCRLLPTATVKPPDDWCSHHPDAPAWLRARK